MSMHDEYVEKIKEQAIRVKENKIDLNDKAACEKEKILLCGALIKCADISNCVSLSSVNGIRVLLIDFSF